MITALYKSTYLLTYLVMPGLIYLNSIAGSKPMEYNDKKPSNIYIKHTKTRTWANAQRDGRPAEHRWRPVFNAAKFG